MTRHHFTFLPFLIYNSIGNTILKRKGARVIAEQAAAKISLLTGKLQALSRV